MSINKRKTAAGIRYDVRLRDPAGKEYCRTFKTEKEAKGYDATERADRSRGLWVDPRLGSITFREWAAMWLDGDPTKRAKTKATDEVQIRLHMNPTFGDRPLAAITPLDIRRLVGTWTVTYAPNTVRRMHSVLRAIFTSAVEAEILGRSPCRKIRLPTAEPQERHQVTAVEIQALAEAVGPDYRTMVYVAGVLGLRFSECAALRVGRLDLLRSSLTVAEALADVRGTLVFTAPKSRAGRRSMTIPAPLVAMLSDHLSRKGLTGADPNALVFTAVRGGALRYGNWRRRVWIPATTAAKLPCLGFHDLRRASATAMVAMGVDVRTAQARLGHSDPRLTLELYAQATQQGDKDAAVRLGEHFMSRLEDVEEAEDTGA